MTIAAASSPSPPKQQNSNTAAARMKTLMDTKSLYRDSISQLQDIFPDWSVDDLATALSDLDGDLVLAVHRISEGHIQPWSEQGKKPHQQHSSAPFSYNSTHSKREVLLSGKQAASNSRRQNAQSAPLSSSARRGRNSGDVGGRGDQRILEKDVGTPVSSVVPKEQETAGTPASPRQCPEAATAHSQASEELSKASHAPLASVMRYRSIKAGSSSTKSVENEPFPPAAAPRQENIAQDCLEKRQAEKPTPCPRDLSEYVDQIVEDRTTGAVPSVGSKDLPVVEMPKSLSSRISAASMVQPVVVLPSRATVRQGLCVSFGVSTPPALPVLSAFTGPAMPSSAESLASPRTFDEILEQPLKTSPGTSSYRSTGVEATLDAFGGKDLIGRKNQPIQRPGGMRDNYLSSPPGLRTDEGASAVPVKVGDIFAASGSGGAKGAELEAAPGLSSASYYAQPAAPAAAASPSLNRHHQPQPYHQQPSTNSQSPYAARSFDQFVTAAGSQHQQPSNGGAVNAHLNSRHLQNAPWPAYMNASQPQQQQSHHQHNLQQHHPLPAAYYSNYSQQFYADPSLVGGSYHHQGQHHQAPANYGGRPASAPYVTAFSGQHGYAGGNYYAAGPATYAAPGGAGHRQTSTAGYHQQQHHHQQQQKDL